MASKADAERILERNTSTGSPRLNQDNYERTEKRSNATALALILITGLFLTVAYYVWQYNGLPMFGSNTANTTVVAPAPAANPNAPTNTTN